MDLAQQYISKIEHHLKVLLELEKEYKGRNKSSIYLEKRRHNKNAAEHWRQKLLNLGRESTILIVRFSLAVPHKDGVSIYKRFKTYYVGLNEDMARQLVLIENPLATEFDFKIISPGILKEI